MKQSTIHPALPPCSPSYLLVLLQTGYSLTLVSAESEATNPLAMHIARGLFWTKYNKLVIAKVNG
jgi:hypothetical protein